jgi:uncharacterized repeat protein (TIGR03803 family)
VFSKSDGNFPNAMIRGDRGNFVGTTTYGGTNNLGAVFKLTSQGRESIIFSFSSGTGEYPEDLSKDDAGNLYGVSYYTGAGGACCGLVFKIAPDGTETTFYSFHGGSDGANPAAGLIRDEAGNFYGTTFFGGGGNECGWQPPSGCGTVYKLAPDGTETVLYAFAGGSDGSNPQTRLTLDSAGNLYGSTYLGGSNEWGVVFKLAPNGVQTVLHSFSGGADGRSPGKVHFIDNSGKIYGTAFFGGNTGCGGIGCGTIFSLAPDGTLRVLHTFSDGSDGAWPNPELTYDGHGTLYGTTQLRGGGACSEGCGTVFKLSPASSHP